MLAMLNLRADNLEEMERNKLAIDSEATELVFDKYGGVKDWLEACYEQGRPTDEEQEHYDTISLAVLMQAMENRPILSQEQEEVYESIVSGLNFGMLVLSYNFLHGPDSIDPNIVNHALVYVSDVCGEYIDDVESLFNGGETSNKSETGMDDKFAAIDLDLRNIVDRYIDQLCPDLSLQHDFRQGAMMAEKVFANAIRLSEESKSYLESLFADIISNLNLD